MHLVELRNVSKSYTEPGSQLRVPVLQNLSFSLQAGESVAIVGPSGCGKSTLLNIIGTLDEADTGELLIDGQTVTGASLAQLAELRSQKMGFIFQLHHLLPQCSVLENVLVPTLTLKGREQSATETRERAIHLLNLVGLEQRLSWRPSQLSGGERQRVAVVRALINQPRLILADEPTGALDEANAATLTDLLISLQKETGVALVLVTHHPAQAARMGRTLALKDGTLTDSCA